DPKKDRKAGPVRDYRTDPILDPRLAVGNQSEERAISLPKPSSGTAAPLYPTICADRPRLGGERRARQFGLRHALDAPDKGGADLSENRQPASGPAAPGAHEAGEHRPLPRDRGR